MPEPIKPAGPDPRESAAAAIAPDAVTAAILAKHSAGQPLTPQESGKLGWWRSQLNKLKPGAPGARPGPIQPGPGPGKPALVAPLASVEASADGLAPVPVDANLVKRTTAGVLKSADTIARRYVGRQARLAGADDKTAARFDSAASLPVPSQELLVDISPEVLDSLGMDPRSYPLTVAMGILGLWGTNLWLVVDELKEMQNKHKPLAAAPAGPAPVTPGPGVPMPVPASPPGAPRKFT